MQFDVRNALRRPANGYAFPRCDGLAVVPVEARRSAQRILALHQGDAIADQTGVARRVGHGDPIRAARFVDGRRGSRRRGGSCRRRWGRQWRWRRGRLRRKRRRGRGGCRRRRGGRGLGAGCDQREANDGERAERGKGFGGRAVAQSQFHAMHRNRGVSYGSAQPGVYPALSGLRNLDGEARFPRRRALILLSLIETFA